MKNNFPLSPSWSKRFTAASMTVVLLSACGAGGADSDKSQLNLEEVAQAGASFDQSKRSVFGDFLAGRHAEAVRETPDAADFFNRAHSKEPENIDLLKRSFLFSAMEGRMDKAVKLAEEVLAAAGTDPIATLVLLSSDVEKGDFTAAEKRLDGLPKTGVSVFMRPLLQAWALAGAGKTDEALKALDSLNQNGGYRSLFDMHTALINEAGGREEAAEKAFLKAAETPAGMTLRVVELLGGLYERQGNRDKAIDIYQKYLETHPASLLIDPIIARAKSPKDAKPAAITPKNGIAEALFGIASSMRQQNAQDSALIFTRLALQLYPEFPIARILLGDVLEAYGRLEEANKVYGSIGPNSPFQWTARLRSAANFNSLDQEDKAIALLETMAAERPTVYDPLVELGNLLRGREKYEAAASAYDRAFKRIGNVTERHWSLLYSRGIALERSKRWPEAEKDFLKALELEPDQPFVLNYLGYSWVEQGLNLDRAQDMIKKAVKLRPRDGYIVDSLGWVQYRLGDYPAAVRNLERAVELRPEDPTINDHLGDAYWRIGRKLEAGFQWRRALSLNPEPELTDTIKGKIDNGLGPAKTIK